MSKYDKLEYSRLNKLINPFYSRYNDIANINQIIPLSKLYEVSENIYSSIKEVIDYEIPNGFDFYNKTATNVFFLLEQSGVGIKYDAFNSIFKPKNTLYNTLDNKVLTQYNLYNTTSRPTNSFNSVNFAAIPHTEEHRKCFTPANDYFVEFDFDGYHLRLLAEQIEYALTSDSAHKQLARLYFNKKEITDDEYKEAKQINFHAIYGKIPEKYSFLEIFTRIDDYIKELWKRYKDDGEVLAPISGKPFTASLKAMNPQKLMNYVMQSLETSRNIVVLKKLLKYLQTKKTTISLYTYDSIIMDFDKEDGKDTLENIKSIMEEGGKYPVSFKYSKDLSL
jgi:DNA polymerase I-like protein with 3'-5' exonuclease and polymerase domains